MSEKKKMNVGIHLSKFDKNLQHFFSIVLQIPGDLILLIQSYYNNGYYRLNVQQEVKEETEFVTYLLNIFLNLTKPLPLKRNLFEIRFYQHCCYQGISIFRLHLNRSLRSPPSHDVWIAETKDTVCDCYFKRKRAIEICQFFEKWQEEFNIKIPTNQKFSDWSGWKHTNFHRQLTFFFKFAKEKSLFIDIIFFADF